MDEPGALDNPQIKAVADRLEAKFASDDRVSTEEVDDVVRDSVESFNDAPIQGFVHLLAEHKATSRLRGLSRLRAARRAGGAARQA